MDQRRLDAAEPARHDQEFTHQCGLRSRVLFEKTGGTTTGPGSLARPPISMIAGAACECSGSPWGPGSGGKGSGCGNGSGIGSGCGGTGDGGRGSGIGTGTELMGLSVPILPSLLKASLWIICLSCF